MSRIGWVSAALAIVLALATVALWSTDDDTADRPLANGAQLFQLKGCSTCHGGPDSVARIVDFPPLDHADEWAGSRREGMTAREYLAESMRSPGAFMSPVFRGNGPTTGMPQLHLTEAEIDALVTYLLHE